MKTSHSEPHTEPMFISPELVYFVTLSSAVLEESFTIVIRVAQRKLILGIESVHSTVAV